MSAVDVTVAAMTREILANVSGVAIKGRVLLIAGPPGSGKSTLALALIDRGAVLVGDDAVQVSVEQGALLAEPPPNTRGLIQIRNVGIVEMPVASGPIALVLDLDPAAPRYPLAPGMTTIDGIAIPALAFAADDAVQALRAEHALIQHGLIFPRPTENA